MKRAIGLAITLAVAALLLAGCDESDTVYVYPADTTPPSVPRGVTSVTGDEMVSILWYGSTEEDLAGFRVWRANAEGAEYRVIARIDVDPTGPDDPPVDWQYDDTPVTNGHTYFYAVSAFDFDGNESALSYEDVFDTPRPAGYDVLLDADEPLIAGFDFWPTARVPLGNSRADIEVVYYVDLGVLAARAADLSTDIQDFGYTDNLDALGWAPTTGWTSLGWCELIVGHSYAVWTRDNNYAKFRVTARSGRSVLIDWAYQTDTGNPELKRRFATGDTLAVKGQ